MWFVPILFLCLAVAAKVATAGVKTNQEILADWQPKINAFDAFFTEDDTQPLNKEGYPEGLYMPLIGNGYLSHAKGVRSDIMYVSGIFNGETTSPSHRAKIPATYAVTVENSKPIGVLLDIRQGSYHRRGYISDSQAGWYELRWYAHRQERGLYVLDIDVHNDGGENLTLKIQNPFFDGKYVSEDFTFEHGGIIPQGENALCGHTNIPETSDGPTHTVCFANNQPVPATLVVSAQEPKKTFTFITAFRTSLDAAGTSADVKAAAQADLAHAMNLQSSEMLYISHVDSWSRLWQTSPISIQGREDVAQAVNASMFAIFSSVRDDWSYGLAPGGLTNYYNGHAFWDTETWMYPSLLLLQPKIAASLLQYRFDRLAGAHLKAASYTPPFAGAMFPWESAFSGVETCPAWAATGQREDHISGDIALAMWQYWLTSRDETWLKNVGYPVLSDIADFWFSRAVYGDDDKTKAHILGVIPPDEYVDHVDDSVYTNVVASLALSFFVQAHALLYATASSETNALRVQQYAQLAKDLVILFDDNLHIHPEYAGYAGDLVKQADVILLHYPLGLAMNSTIQKNDLDYYATRTDLHGPAMTWGMQSIGYLDLSDVHPAAKFFNQSFQDNMHAPFHVWTETPDGNAVNFITGAGGFLQTVVNGYMGLRIVHDAHVSTPKDLKAFQEQILLKFKPTCMPGASQVSLQGVYLLSRRYAITMECDANTDTLVKVTVEQVKSDNDKEEDKEEDEKAEAKVLLVQDKDTNTYYFVLLGDKATAVQDARSSFLMRMPAQWTVIDRF